VNLGEGVSVDVYEGVGDDVSVGVGVGASKSVKGRACGWISGSVQADVRQNEWQWKHPLSHTLKISTVMKPLPLGYYTESTQIPQLLEYTVCLVTLCIFAYWNLDTRCNGIMTSLVISSYRNVMGRRK